MRTFALACASIAVALLLAGNIYTTFSDNAKACHKLGGRLYVNGCWKSEMHNN